MLNLRTDHGHMIASRQAALNLATSLTDQIRGRAEQAEENRRIPDKTISELMSSGLFHLLTPKSLGGSEIGFASLFEVTVELASACGSTGWVYGVLAGHSWMLHLFPEQAQREVFADPEALTATVFRLGGNYQAVEGGYRLTEGNGRFCSGIDFASWVIVGGAVTRPDGSKEPRFFVLPKEDIVVVDDWFTAGMRGTGSRSIRIADAFIPEHRSVSVTDMQSGESPGTQLAPGPLYRHGFSYVTPFSIVGAPIGMARGALRSSISTMGSSLAKSGPNEITEQRPAIIELAAAGSDIDAAYAIILADAEQVDRSSGTQEISAADRIRIPHDWGYGVQMSRRATNKLFENAGGSAIYSNSAIQRFWRDVNAAAQHRAFGWQQHMGDYGRVLLGLEASGYKLKTV